MSGLLARYPDLTELGPDEIDDSPWADGPMSGNARGPLIYISMVTNEAASVYFALKNDD